MVEVWEMQLQTLLALAQAFQEADAGNSSLAHRVQPANSRLPRACGPHQGGLVLSP